MLKNWVDNVQDVWIQSKPEIENEVSPSLIHTFEMELNTLINLCKEDERGEKEELYVRAEHLHRLWEEIVSHVDRQSPRPVPIGGHRLPPLRYRYDALEPYISEETMRLHHDKHHQSYVDGLNKAELELKKARDRNEYELIKHWEKEAAFHGAGHYLHSIFWEVMHPDGGGEPKGKLAEQIKRDFGSVEKMKRHFSEAAKAVEGGGWAMLVWSPRSGRLQILQAEKHQNLSQQDVIPLLVLDVWEHAYYLQYKNERDKYIENWWEIVYWPEVENRFEKASQLVW